MTSRKLYLPGLLLALGPVSIAAADPAPAAPPPTPPLDVTMRVIENPEAMTPEAVMRRIEFPAPPAPPGPAGADEPPQPEQAAEGRRIAEEARERNRDFGQEAAEQAREMADQAADLREEFGRSKAEEMRPDPPEPPVPPRP